MTNPQPHEFAPTLAYANAARSAILTAQAALALMGLGCNVTQAASEPPSRAASPATQASVETASAIARALAQTAPKELSAGAEQGEGAFLPTSTSADDAPFTAPAGMVWLSGGEFSMGSADPSTSGYCHEPMDDARPIHRVAVSGFFIDRTEVTNARFAEFVEATGYVTVAERTPTAEEMPGVPEHLRFAGSSVFTPRGNTPLNRPLAWWSYIAGADWRHPQGPASSIEGASEHPVVHVAYADALAYAHWAGKDLPTEAEWEFAARGGRSGSLYPWGDEAPEAGEPRANTFQGRFPAQNTASDGYAGTAPVASYAANGYGLYDMAGNVWEWTRDWYRPDSYSSDAARGLVHDPRGPSSSVDPSEPGVQKRVQRGGSYLCTNAYCTRYMVGSRGKGEPNSPSGHVGFRCVKRPSNAAL